MSLIERIKTFFEDRSLSFLLKVFIIALTILVVQNSMEVYTSIYSVAMGILTPFFIAFVIAYITHPLFTFMQSKKIPKGVAIFLFWVVFILLFCLLLIVLIPMIYDKCLELISSLNNSIVWATERFNEFEADSPITEMLVTNVLGMLSQVQGVLLPDLTKLLPTLANQVISGLTSILLIFIISVYMMIDYESIKNGIMRVSSFVYKTLPTYIQSVDEVVGVYFRSVLILMLVKFLEYSLLYYVVGHKDWLIIGVLTALGLFVPFVGATIANAVGIATAFTLPLPNIFFLLLGIVVLSNIDAYIIAPIVHSKRSLIRPLWTLFSIMAGGVIAGGVGIFFAVPVYLSVRAIYQTYVQRKETSKLKSKNT